MKTKGRAAGGGGRDPPLSGMMQPLISDPWFLAVGAIAVILLGISKGGFAGVGALGTPLLALVVGPIEAAAIILPILIVQDVVGVWAFRKSWDGRILAVMLPGAAIGITLAYGFATRLPEAGMQILLGLISVLFALRSLWLRRGGRVPAPADPPSWFGFLMGVVSGVTSQIAHAGQPPFQIYVLPRRLPRDVLVGTTAIFFAVVNWIKVPAYIALGQFSRAHLLASLVLMPLAFASTLAGVWLVRRVDADRFYDLIYWLMLLVGLKLIYDGLT
jgi:uncharacterized membrane protein YfcA